MALQGRAGAALGIAAIGSFIAGTVATLGLTFLAPPLAEAALAFGPPEYFALVVLGLTALAAVSGGSVLKGLAAGVAGLLVATIGVLLYTTFLFDFSNRGNWIPYLMVLAAESVIIVQALIALWTILSSGHNPRGYRFHNAQNRIYGPDHKTIEPGTEMRGKLGPGIDVKRHGKGYVAFPPSAGYSWLVKGRRAKAPKWLLEELTTTRAFTPDEAAVARYFPFQTGTPYGEASLKNGLQELRDAGEGHRHATLNKVAFGLGML